MRVKKLFWVVGCLAVGAGALAALWAGRQRLRSPKHVLIHGTPEGRQWAIRQLVEKPPDDHEWKMIVDAVEDNAFMPYNQSTGEYV